MGGLYLKQLFLTFELEWYRIASESIQVTPKGAFQGVLCVCVCVCGYGRE